MASISERGAAVLDELRGIPLLLVSLGCLALVFALLAFVIAPAIRWWRRPIRLARDRARNPNLLAGRSDIHDTWSRGQPYWLAADIAARHGRIAMGGLATLLFAIAVSVFLIWLSWQYGLKQTLLYGITYLCAFVYAFGSLIRRVRRTFATRAFPGGEFQLTYDALLVDHAFVEETPRNPVVDRAPWKQFQFHTHYLRVPFASLARLEVDHQAVEYWTRVRVRPVLWLTLHEGARCMLHTHALGGDGEARLLLALRTVNRVPIHIPEHIAPFYGYLTQPQ